MRKLHLSLLVVAISALAFPSPAISCEEEPAAEITSKPIEVGDELRDLCKRRRINIEPYVRSAGKGAVSSLKRIMEIQTDGAASEDKSTLLSDLIKRVGDAKFAQAVSQTSKSTRETVTMFICSDQNLSNAGLKRWYPRTASAAGIK